MSEFLNSNVKAWEGVLSELRTSLGDTVVKSWLAPVVAGDFSNGVLKLYAPTRFIKDWVQRHYEQDIFQASVKYYPGINSLSFGVNAGCDRLVNTDSHTLPSADNVADTPRDSDFVDSSSYTSPRKTYARTYDYDLSDMSSSLDSDYTFDSFIMGESNEFAASAMKKVITDDSNSFSPLFLSSSVGLGKTHLIQSAAAYLGQTLPDKKVLYLSAEKFMYRFVESLKTGDSVAFKELFRSVDVLLMDDVQFMSGKDATQQEFLHTFDALTSAGKKIILTANCAASQLVDFDERLKSRLASGLEVNIAAPDYGLRLDILNSKVKKKKCTLSADVIEFIASRFTRSIRELEGALNRLIAHTDLLGRSLNVPVAAKILKDSGALIDRVVSIDRIQQVVADFYGIKLSDMRSVRKQKEVALPRQVAMYLAKEMTTRSLPDIARSFDRDHATVLYAVRKIKNLIDSDAVFNHDLTLIRSGLEES